MQRFIRSGLAFALTVAAGAASAADLPRRAQMPAKAPELAAPLYNWSGFYLGINGGGAWGTSRWDAPAAGVTTGSFDISGGLVGGTAGFNMQTGQIVWGLEGDIAWADIGGSSAAAACGTRCETHIGWLGTVRGRLGYAIDRFLPYVTGGLAVGEVRTRIPGIGLADGNTTKAGWTIGGGAEFALTTNISAKAEYLYVDLGRVDCGAPCAPGGTPVHVKSNAHVVRAGLNFRF